MRIQGRIQTTKNWLMKFCVSWKLTMMIQIYRQTSTKPIFWETVQSDNKSSNINQIGGATGSHTFGNQLSLIQVDNDINLIKDHNQLTEINKLTEMLYPANKDLINFVGRQYIHLFKATCNKFIRTAHLLQLFERKMLKIQKLLPILT